MSVLFVVGVGPGIGLSVARRFAREGWAVGVLARSEPTVAAAARELAAWEVPVVTAVGDAAEETALRSALDRLVGRLGEPDVVVYNAALVRPDAVGELSVPEHQAAWAVNVVGAITTAARLLPAMAARGSGSFLVTGGMPEARPEYVSLSLGKAGVRALVSLLAERYGPEGVHVATVTVAGTVAPGSDFDPDDIAERYWRLHAQPRPEWVREVVHGPGPEGVPGSG